MKKRRWLILLGILMGFAIWVLTVNRRAMIPNKTNGLINSTNVTIPIENPTRRAKSSPEKILAETPPNIQNRIEQIKRDEREYKLLWRTPLLFYGKVVDENGDPIPNVQVSYSGNALDESLTREIRNRGTVTTDQRGIFKIDGINGIGLMFNLHHPGYYVYPDTYDNNGFDVRSPPKSGIVPDSEGNAAIFRMHSKGNPVSLVHRRSGADVPIGNGNAVVKLFGKEDGQIVGTLNIEAGGDTPKNWSPQPYDWSARLSVPGGGLVESSNHFEFVAPESGYQPSIEIKMSKNQPGWSDSADKWFFLKLPSGYARMRIHMRAKTPLYVSLEYYVNPDGSPNLEPMESTPQQHELPPGVIEVIPEFK